MIAVRSVPTFSRRALLVRSAVAASLAIPLKLAAAAPPGSSGQVYTANERDGSISILDLATLRVRTVPIGLAPHNVQISADGRWLLAVGEPVSPEHGHAHDGGGGGHTADTAGRLLVLPADDSLAGGAVTDIAVGRHPAHVVADREGRLAFVTLAGEDAVALVDLLRGTPAGRIATGRYPHGLRLSPDGGELYVANVEDGSVSVLDPLGRAELARVAVGRSPVQVGVTADQVYVSLRGEDRVAVLERATRRLVAKVPVGRGPVQVYPSPDGRRLYVASQGTDAEPDDTVSVIDTGTRTVTATIRAGRGAHGVVVSDDGARAFVTNVLDGTLTIIDTAASAALTSVPVGAGPNGVTFRPSAPA